MERNSFKVYCAGPLFNPSERKEMGLIANSLRQAGYSVFLPQEDGLEFSKLFPAFLKKGVQPEQAQQLLNHAIFALDVFQVKDSSGLVLNMNGRVPDEGAMVEAGIAWSFAKPIVILNSDDRSLLQGNHNPLVLGLACFETVQSYDDIPSAFDRKFEEVGDRVLREQPDSTEESLTKGKTISECLNTDRDENRIAELLLDLFGGRTCLPSSERNGSYSPANMQP